MTVNKPEIVKRVAEKAEMRKGATEKFMDALLEVVAEALANDEKIKIYGFMSIETVNVDNMVKKNPKTQEDIEVPAHKKVRVKIGEGLKATINQ